MNCAIIDVGSNSIRLMILVDGKEIYAETQTTQLGKALATSGMIGGEEFARSIEVIDMFCKRARLTHAFQIHIFATEAVRKAQNGRNFALAVYSRTGEKLQILSGEKEAEIGFVGAVGCDNTPSIVIDIGGASSEIAIGANGKVDFSQSIAIGAVKLHSCCFDDKQKTIDYIDESLRNVSNKLIDNHTSSERFGAGENLIKTYVIGGTATSIATLLSGVARYDKSVTHGYIIEIEKLNLLVDKLFEMGEEGRKQLLSIKKERREIIASGAMLLLKMMQKLNISEVVASEDDNLIGYYRVFVGD